MLQYFKRLCYFHRNARHLAKLRAQWKWELALGAEEMRARRFHGYSPETPFHGFDR